MRKMSSAVGVGLVAVLILGGCGEDEGAPPPPPVRLPALTFGVQPSAEEAGVAIAPAITVELRDGADALVTTFTEDVTLAVVSGPGALLGTVTQTAVAGVATFDAASIEVAGTYTLVATAPGVTDAPASAAFVIDPAAAETLAFTDEPAGAASNQPLGTVKVTLYDGFGNVATNDDSTLVTVTETGGTATLLGTPSRTAVDGVATFSDLSITEVGTNYTLDADSGAMTTATSATFDVIPDLVITTQ
ncbi:MAG: hypothetical protein ACYTFI_11320, partial [Planctomycetota bacterium]